MALRRRAALWLAVMLAFLSTFALAEAAPVSPAEQAATRRERALLVGIDEFVSQPSAYPSSTNNVYAMQELFQASETPLETLLLPQEPVTSAEQLIHLIRYAFGGAQAGDVSYLYISTHGVYDPENGVAPALLLSNGVVEGSISPQQLEDAFQGIEGDKVLILDACNSGAFIGKGMVEQPETVAFSGGDFKVLTSSGAMEESWYWSSDKADESGGKPQGAFYFTQALCEALSAANGHPADQNHDGQITLSELYDYLLLNHAASTPQVFPQRDDFVVFRYDVEAALPTGLARSPIMDVTFSGTVLTHEQRDITLEFIAMRPVQVAYQIVYQQEGRWAFENAQLIYDEAERFTAFGDRQGAVSAGRKARTLTLDALPEDAYGYVMVQLVSIEQGKLRVHAGRVLCVLPQRNDQSLAVQTAAVFDRSVRPEMAVFAAHDYPCALSVMVVDEAGAIVYRLCHRSSTRPMQLIPDGTMFYWDGTLKDGSAVPDGIYRIRAQTTLNGQMLTAESDPFEIK